MVSYEASRPKDIHKPVVLAKDIKSMQHLSSTVSSFPYGPSTYHLVDGNLVTVTSGNKFWTTPQDAKKYGTFFSQLDDGVRRGSVKFSSMDDWIANGTIEKPNLPKNQPIPNFYDLTGGEIGGITYIEGARQFRLWTPDKGDTQVNLYTTPRLVEITDINSIGKRTSQVENFRQKIHSDLLFNDRNQLHYEIVKWAEFLDSEGVHPTKHPVLGIGVSKADYTAAHYPESSYLLANTNFHEMAKEWISRYGLSDSESVSAMERAVIMHELAHAYGVNGRRDGEQRQGRLWKKFYSKLSKEFEGTKFEKVYRALEHLGEDYERRFSFINDLIQGGKDHDEIWNLMSHKFYHEAEKLGLKGRAAANYIRDREKDSLGPLYNDEESHETESRTASRSNVNSLERIVEISSGEAQGKADSNYTRTNAAAKVLKFSERKSKGTNSERNSKTYARSSAGETYEGRAQSAYAEDSRNAEADGGETPDVQPSDKGDSNSESGAEIQASEKAA